MNTKDKLHGLIKINIYSFYSIIFKIKNLIIVAQNIHVFYICTRITVKAMPSSKINMERWQSGNAAAC